MKIGTIGIDRRSNKRVKIIDSYKLFGTTCIKFDDGESITQMSVKHFREYYTTKCYDFASDNINYIDSMTVLDFEWNAAKRKFKEIYNHLAINEDFPHLIYIYIELIDKENGLYKFSYNNILYPNYKFEPIEYKFRNWNKTVK